MPDSIETMTGNGFSIKDGKIVTKYTVGVSIMQLPFLLIAEAGSWIQPTPVPGFTPWHHKAIDLAAVFWFVIGLYLLIDLSLVKYSAKTLVIGYVPLVFGTHLLYYTIDETGMSHVYSFALFAILQWLLVTARSDCFSWRVGLVTSMILVVRPTGLLFVVWAFWMNRDKIRFTQRKWISVIVPVLCFLCPILIQMAYWSYAYGTPVADSYAGEYFYWFAPQFLRVWFAPANGVFVWTPFYAIAIVAALLQIGSDRDWVGSILILFFAISWVAGSWWDPGFGCGLGNRFFTEYLVVLIWPFLSLIQNDSQWSQPARWGFYFVLATITLSNLHLTYSYDGCFAGSGIWDWNAWVGHLTAPLK